ncbi:UNVERIFIED_CONTAM: Thioredoxin Y1, chloroplastic [Sesamum calycinum]|uniref:Thioredoxin Y1, chloroplastic n=1 Tax=Sesamum calycinum TaxID=2727403 RepID=A0AAW2P8W5_9LAMI
MAISLAAAVPRMVATTSPSSSFANSKLANFSSLQFPTQLRISGIGNHCLKSKHRPRTLTLISTSRLMLSYRCGPCQFMVPILEQVSAKMIDKIQVVKIDTEKYPSIANDYSIEALPTFILFKDGKPFDRFGVQWLQTSSSNASRLHCKISSSDGSCACAYTVK